MAQAAPIPCGPADVAASERNTTDALLALARLASSSSRSREGALPVAARLGARILNVDTLAIRSLEGAPDYVGEPQRTGAEITPGDSGRWGRVDAFRKLLESGGLAAEDTRQDERLSSLVRAGLLGPDAVALIVAPVTVGDRIVAAIVGQRQGPRAWSASDLSAIGTVADLVALIIGSSGESNDRYRKLVESTVDGIVLIDADSGALIDANRAFRRLVGLPQGDLDGFRAIDLFADPSVVAEQAQRLLSANGEWRSETTLRFLSQPPVDVEINSHIVTFDGRLTICAVVRSLAPRRQVARLDHDRAFALEMIATGQPLDLILTHLRRFVESHCSGLQCTFVLNQDPPPEVPEGVESCSTPVNGASGERHGQLVAYGPHPGSEESTAVFKAAATLAGIALDQRRLSDQLAFQAQHDALTGLPNRRLFEDRMRLSLATARRRKSGMALFFIDLDRFKPINDTLGHDVGDHLLRAAAQRIASAVRATDTVARMGGDEFTVILQDIAGPHPAARVAQKILDALRAPFHLLGHELSITCSIGIALHPQDAGDATALQKYADVAMYRAKSSGGNGFRWFTAEMNEEVTERRQVELQLRKVIEKGELSLFYQPQVALDGTTHAVEAFVRWHHPQLGFVLPAHFIPVAEECGLIVPIGAWVLREACRQYMAWQALGTAPDKLSINISSVQFAQSDFVETVGGILKESGIEPNRIELEVTESLLMRDFDKSIERLAALKALGVSIAIDDFGTGQFSLGHLHKLPVDALKVDQSFVKELGRQGNSLALVETIVALARSLRLRVVAEGVENEEQLAILRQLGCDRAQGYLFGKAVVATEILPRLRSSVPPPRRPRKDPASEQVH